MANANTELLDASVRHQVAVQRFTKGQARKVLELLEEADRNLVAKLRRRLRRLPEGVDFTSRRWKRLIKDVRAARFAIMEKAGAASAEDLPGFAKVEHDAELSIFEAALPFEIEFAGVDIPSLNAAISKPFQGQTLEQWWGGLAETDSRRVVREIQLGYSQGESVPNIVKRIAGTRAGGFKDGVLAISRRNAETVVRTAVNHTSQAARETVWAENADVIAALRWTSTLDGRTTPICQSRDGKLTPIGDNKLPEGADALHPPGARPPAHPNCRSAMVAAIDGEVVGERAYVTSTATAKEQRRIWRAEAKRTGRTVKQVREKWQERNIGHVPAKTTYNQWLGRQSKGFQDDVLGPTKGKLFREGGLKLDKFVDRSGAEFTLAELADQNPTAFMKAGLDPADF